MELTPIESKILCKFYDLCFLTLNDEISVRHFYPVCNKRYLWLSIISLEQKGLIESYIDKRIKFIKLTKNGKLIVKALIVIRNIN